MLHEGHEAGLRYLELVSSDASEDESLPLIVFLHGRGDRAHSAWIDGLSVRARFVFPEAPLPFGDGFSWFAFSITGSDPATLARDVAERATQLAGLLDALARKYPTRGKPIVAGFSQGAMLTFALALEHPDAIALGLPIAGMIPEPLLQRALQNGARIAKLRALHGTSDHVIAFAPTASATEQLRARGHDVQLQAFPATDHTLSPAMREALFASMTRALTEVN